MYGAFLSQLVAGNTNMNKWNSHARNPLNILQTSGLRIYIELDSELRLLSVPSVWKLVQIIRLGIISGMTT